MGDHRDEEDIRAQLADLPCACSNLRRASRAVTQLYTRELRQVGLKPTQFTSLMALSLLGSMPQGELAGRLAIDSTTLTRTLAPLIRKGWILSETGEDRRERLIRLTSSGRDCLEKAKPCWKRAQGRILQTLGLSEWETLQESLVTVTRAARRLSP
jgi:DNA-binding MarR family transcriptional regulator